VALQAARLNNQAADYVPFLGEGAALAIADVPLAAPAPQAPAPAADPANAAAPAAVEPAAQPAPARRGLFWWVPGW
jgi:2-oxoglutarate dehydrogenase E2 component (dihydrolipoamide succinyltransferase)